MIDVGSFLQHNQFASGGLLIGVVGGAAAWLRSVPSHIYSWVKRQLVIQVEVRSMTSVMYTNKLYKYLSLWITEKTKDKPKRTLKGTYMDLYDPALDEEKETLVYTIGSGSHLIWFNKTPIWISSHRDSGANKEREVESYNLTFFTRNQKVVDSLFDEVNKLRDIAEDGLQKVSGTNRYGDWEEVTKKIPRNLDSVVLPREQKEKIIQTVDTFLSSRQRYEDLGIPWRFGLMLFGPAGTGKSSLMQALAGHLKRNIYFLGLSSKIIDDSQLIKLVNDVPKNGIIFLEDIDCVLPSRDNSENKKEVTLSGLLNALDGVMSKEGQIVFMSTNHIDKVDPAILRPGRVDLSVELGYAIPEQAEELYGRFYPQSPLTERKEFAKLADGKTTMAQLQNILIEKDKSK